MRPFRFARWALLAAVPATLASLPAAPPPPATKGEVERPVKEAVAHATPAAADNPTVDTGKVNWHKTLDDARAAAAKSGKPVLLFQMMGYLDKKFC